MVRKMPNSGFIPTLSPSVKMKVFLRSFLQVSTVAICWAATERTGRSIRLNSSKQPQEPDWARPSYLKKKSNPKHTKHKTYMFIFIHYIIWILLAYMLNVTWPNWKPGAVIAVLTEKRTKSNVYRCLRTFDIDHRCVTPLNILPRPLKSIWSEQLNTTTYLPKQRPMSLVVSVFPVPAGPAGAPPMLIPRAWAKVM